LKPTEKEIEMLRNLTADPSRAIAFEQIARISGDKDPRCYSPDAAEKKFHAVGEKLKLSSMTGWAQSAAAGEADSLVALPNNKRSKKTPDLEVQLRTHPDI